VGEGKRREKNIIFLKHLKAEY